jgi:AraC-like DNA-binding protein
MMGEGAVNHPVEVWFEHTEPADLSEYGQAFLGNKVMFGMPWNGFVFDAALLDQPMPGADDKLHVLIRKHADALLEELPRAQSFTQRVRELLLKELEGGNPSAVRIASALHMSGRTLTRRLEDEGTTFKDLLDDLRKSLSLRYVGSTDLGLSEIAFLLGFSQSAAFHRAFKRWTAQTPLEYRRARRG